MPFSLGYWLPWAAPLRWDAAERRPNFLFVYTDDHRWDAMGVVQREHGERARFPWFKSPGMDRLAAEGVRFRNAFVTLSLCAPSRAAFLTGRYNHLNGIANNNTPFPADSVTHASLLRAAGYKTAYIGKWHMGNQRGPRPGFDYSASYVGQGRYQDCPFEINGASTPTKGWVDDVAADFAIEYMKQNKEQPFSIVLGFKSPHGPRGGNQLPERLRGLHDGQTTRPTPNCGVPAPWQKPDAKTGELPRGLADNAVHLDYLRHIRGVDENLVKLLEALDTLGLAEDTVVVYASDNGYFLGEHCSGDKRALYDESLRIPFLVRYPRLFGKGVTVDEMVLNLDLAPTFLDLAGVPVPSEMQGASWKEARRRSQAGAVAAVVLRRILQGTRRRADLLRAAHHDTQTRKIPQPPRVDGSLRPCRRPLRNQEPCLGLRANREARNRADCDDDDREIHSARQRQQTTRSRQVSRDSSRQLT